MAVSGIVLAFCSPAHTLNGAVAAVPSGFVSRLAGAGSVAEYRRLLAAAARGFSLPMCVARMARLAFISRNGLSKSASNCCLSLMCHACASSCTLRGRPPFLPFARAAADLAGERVEPAVLADCFIQAFDP